MFKTFGTIILGRPEDTIKLTSEPFST